MTAEGLAYIWKVFPEVEALASCAQDPDHHPEGNVHTHTFKVLDMAFKVRDKITEEWRFPFMLGMLLHDVGKPDTFMYRKGKVTSYDHDNVGAIKAAQILSRITEDLTLIEQASNVVKYHMRPRMMVDGHSKPKKWKEMADKVPLYVLAYVVYCDNNGRGFPIVSPDEDEYFRKILEGYYEQ